MSAFAAIALVVGGLIAVAIAILVTDIARGDVGGHHTMQRVRRLLVVSTDDRTAAGADRWIESQRVEHPTMQYFVLKGSDDQETYVAAEEAIERDRLDAVVVARHAEDSHATQAGLYGRFKEDLHVPVDAIYIEGATS